MTKDKCNHPSAYRVNTSILLLGIKSTFFESAILICIPTLVFATAFALTLDGHGDLQQWKFNNKVRAARLVIGLGLATLIDLLLARYPLYHPVYQRTQYATIYFLGYLFPYALSTFFVYGLSPPLASALFSFHHSEEPKPSAPVIPEGLVLPEALKE